MLIPECKQESMHPANKQTAPPPVAKPASRLRSPSELRITIPVEEVRDIRTAFDIFDGDLSGIVDPVVEMAIVGACVVVLDILLGFECVSYLPFPVVFRF
jgi:hypothetical protein